MSTQKILSLGLEDFPARRRLRSFEGGTVYVAERGENFYVICDERAMADLLCESDLAGMTLVSVYEFRSAIERASFTADRFGVEG